MNLDDAIQTHFDWKMKLRSAISSQAHLDAATIAKDNCCALGIWLHGEAQAKFGDTTVHRECVAAHAVFHREAAKVAQLVNDRKYDDAGDALAGGTAYVAASNAVGGAIVKLKRVAKL